MTAILNLGQTRLLLQTVTLPVSIMSLRQFLMGQRFFYDHHDKDQLALFVNIENR